MSIDGISPTELCLPFGVFCLEQAEVRLPLVADDLAAGEAPDRDDHGEAGN